MGGAVGGAVGAGGRGTFSGAGVKPAVGFSGSVFAAGCPPSFCSIPPPPLPPLDSAQLPPLDSAPPLLLGAAGCPPPSPLQLSAVKAKRIAVADKRNPLFTLLGRAKQLMGYPLSSLPALFLRRVPHYLDYYEGVSVLLPECLYRSALLMA